jgi:hypothetical protein
MLEGKKDKTFPTFYPSLIEFQSFSDYIEKIEISGIASEFGACKIVPPKGWYNKKYDHTSLDISINHPIKQIVSGRAGVYGVDLLELKEMTLDGFYKYTQKSNNFNEATNEEREKKFWKCMGNSSHKFQGNL